MKNPLVNPLVVAVDYAWVGERGIEMLRRLHERHYQPLPFESIVDRSRGVDDLFIINNLTLDGLVVQMFSEGQCFLDISRQGERVLALYDNSHGSEPGLKGTA